MPCFTKTFVLLIGILTSNYLVAQNPGNSANHSLNNVIPPAPNAAAIGKFGDLPIGPSTGIPSVSVPIYSYKNSNGELNMDISLNYHGGGVRVDEVASDVGIGWALNAGGVISRSMRGIPDELEYYGFINAGLLPATELAGNYRTTSTYWGNVDAGVIDGQPDIFSFNMADKSGKFMFGKRNDFLMLTSSKVKVEKVIGNAPGMTSNPVIIKFILTDEIGRKYIFDALESSLATGPTWTATKHFVSSWYLTKIIAPFYTDSISISYENVYYEYIVGESESYTIGISNPVDPMGSRPSAVSNTAQAIAGKRVKTITFPNSTIVDFSYDTNQRTDLPQLGVGAGLFRLKKITISNGASSRGYNLYHDYSLNRLTLLKVLPFNQAGEDKGYSFEYHGGITPTPLPARLSLSQDHWGYYNNNSFGRIPQEYFVDGQDGANARLLNGADREVDLDRVKVGSLTKVYYPTGGYTQFEMEANKAEDARIKRSFYIKPNPNVTSNEYIYCQSGSTTSENFTVNPDPNTNVSFDVSFNWGSNTCNGSCKMVLELWNSSNQILSSEEIPISGNELTVYHSFSRYNMASGTYTWKVYIQGVDNYAEYVAVTATEIHQQPAVLTQVYKPYIGGLRVKKIQDFDGINAVPATSREFEYLKDDEVTTSGTIASYPVYSYLVRYAFRGGGLVGEIQETYYEGNSDPNSIVRASSPNLTSPAVNGSIVAYSRVTEKIKNNGKSNGKIVRYFTSFEDHPVNEQNAFPYTPPEYKDWSYGLLKKEIIYKEDGLPVKQTVNEYDHKLDNSYELDGERQENFRSVSIAPVSYIMPNLTFPMMNYWLLGMGVAYYKTSVFYPVAGHKELVKTTTTEYNGASNLVNEITYTYDAAFNINKTLTKNSRNEQIEEIVHYPYEYTTNAVASAMITQNMYAPSIAIEKWKTIGSNRYLTGGIVNQYQQLASGIRLSSIESFESPAPVITGSVPALNPASFNRAPTLFKEAITFNQYSNKGFVIQQAKSNDVQQSIIWDHNQQMPTAQVIGSSIDKTAYTSFEADGLGGWTMNSGVVFVPDGITGTKSISGGVNKTVPAGNYVVGVWSKSNTWINGQLQTQTPLKVLGTWRYFELLLTNVTSINISGDNIDEVRLYPQGAQMTTYTYDPLIGLTSQCDANNLITYYEYDGFGRLKTVRDENKNIIKTLDYQYQKSYNQ